MFGFDMKSYAQPVSVQPMTDTTNIQEQMNKHLEEMKIKNPKKYEEMVKRAGGNITHCCSCHVEVKACAGNIPTQQRPTPQIKTPKPPKKF